MRVHEPLTPNPYHGGSDEGCHADGVQNLAHADAPCSVCPWRRDQPIGRFGPDRFEALRATSARGNRSADPGAPMFACHKTPLGGEIACAGWLAVEGVNHVGVRLAVAQERLDPAVLTPAPGWPDLYDTFTEMAAANGAEADTEARR